MTKESVDRLSGLVQAVAKYSEKWNVDKKMRYQPKVSTLEWLDMDKPKAATWPSNPDRHQTARSSGSRPKTTMIRADIKAMVIWVRVVRSWRQWRSNERPI